jgi:hypothetical protein
VTEQEPFDKEILGNFERTVVERSGVPASNPFTVEIKENGELQVRMGDGVDISKKVTKIEITPKRRTTNDGSKVYLCTVEMRTGVIFKPGEEADV